MSACLSVCLSVCLPVCLSVCRSLCLSVCLSVCLYVHISVCLPDCLSVCLSVCLPFCVCLSVHLSLYLPVSVFNTHLNFCSMLSAVSAWSPTSAVTNPILSTGKTSTMISNSAYGRYCVSDVRNVQVSTLYSHVYTRKNFKPKSTFCSYTEPPNAD